MKVWERRIPERDREVMRCAMFTPELEVGQRPGLLVIDVLYSFTGTRPLPILEAITEFRTSCGLAAWEAMPRIRDIIAAFRERNLPVIFVRGDPQAGRLQGGTTRRLNDGRSTDGWDGSEIHEMVAPVPGEPVIVKTKASAFFATPLSVLLHKLQVDGVVLVGCTTSGCVRASAVDAHSSGFDAFVIDDACFDRSEISHDVSLFDLAAKYATVLSTPDLLAQIRRG